MFTGIVEETGKVLSVERTTGGIRLRILAKGRGYDLKVGDSIAVNGCCLTVAKILGSGPRNSAGSKQLQFDVLRETWLRTNFRYLKERSLVNLERPLAANGRFGGHFVTGHIDDVGKIRRYQRHGADHVLEISAAPEILRYVVKKGSIAVDGISLTVADVTRSQFRIWIIPHTHRATNLNTRKAGDAVNLETDLLGKYVERFVRHRSAAEALF